MKKHVRPVLRRMVAATLALVVTGAGMTVAAGPASATVANNEVRQIDFHLGTAGELNKLAYSTFLADLRFSMSTYSSELQGRETQSRDVGLLRIRLHNTAGAFADIWLNPYNLNVLGYSNQRGLTWQLDETGGVLWSRRAAVGDRGVQTIWGLGGSYGSLSSHAGRGRDGMLIGWYDIAGSIQFLSTLELPSGNLRETARSMMLLTNFVAEAARLNDVEGTFRSAMVRTDQRVGLPAAQQSLEDQWARISQWMRFEYANPTSTLSIPNVPTIDDIAEARQYVRVSYWHVSH